MQGSPVFLFLFLLTFLVVAAAAGSQAPLPAEAYWQKVLPNTPMPNILRDAFNPNLGDNKAVPFPFRSYVRLNRYSARSEELNDPKFAVFFLAKDLHPGAKMTLIFSEAASGSTLSHEKMNGSPLLDKKQLPAILKQLSLTPESAKAKAFRETVDSCTERAMKGEDRYCAMSLESMVDFAVSKLGRHVQVLTMTINKANSSPQEYTITKGLQKMKGPRSVACHPLPFIYPVYYCHETTATSVHAVPLVGKDGSKVKAVVVCHKDTSAWNPEYVAFQLLKVKPGTPICHFLPQSHMVWAQN